MSKVWTILTSLIPSGRKYWRKLQQKQMQKAHACFSKMQNVCCHSGKKYKEKNANLMWKFALSFCKSPKISLGKGFLRCHKLSLTYSPMRQVLEVELQIKSKQVQTFSSYPLWRNWGILQTCWKDISRPSSEYLPQFCLLCLSYSSVVLRLSLIKPCKSQKPGISNNSRTTINSECEPFKIDEYILENHNVHIIILASTKTMQP